MSTLRRRVFLSVVSLPLIVGIGEAVRSAWVCDDVFISFRYVDQLLRGNGLVFNAGERIEGFTHFLWVMMLAVCARLGFDLVEVGRYLPILAYATVLIVLARRAWKRRSLGFGVPLAAWCVALHRDMQVFASSGLETAPFTLLVLLGLLAVTSDSNRTGTAAALYAIATLVRPEGALYTAVAGAYVLWRHRSLRFTLRFASVWLALVAPFLVFRWAYYGQLLPNTYYAKSAGHAYWTQGWTYARLYFGIYGVLLACVASVPIVWVLRARAEAQTRPLLDAALLAGMQALVASLYVIRVGGDFMFARFFVPITPFLFIVLEDVLGAVVRRVPSTPRYTVAAAAVLACIAATLYARVPRARTFVGRTPVEGVVDEAAVYTDETIAIMRRQGEILGKYLRGTQARVGLLSGQDAVAYFGRLPYALERHGLTDALLARTPLQGRGRPGHERAASLEHLLRRNVHFRLRYGFTVGLRAHQQIRFDDLYGEIIIYDNDLMASLRRPGITFVEFPGFVDEYAATLEQQNQRRLLPDYVHFQLFYFAHNDDEERLQRLRSALLDHGVPETSLREADRVVRETMARARQGST